MLQASPPDSATSTLSPCLMMLPPRTACRTCSTVGSRHMTDQGLGLHMVGQVYRETR